MLAEQIESLVAQGVAEDSEIAVQVEGNKALVAVVSSSFAGKRRVAREQLLNGLLGDLIASGELHAVSYQLKTPEEA
ncbi:BolA/IbaG family iron-sulfur metabolism protein [Salinibius halmophilus]|uniref:BolA/IbaG family iron-sulfur metabolism protein n=1 Tax=Salinibius halmophilus TaxID=1853216 RepID=UPI000E660F3F|nr:BolA/IbaG family iron-sulfur metabolism protein [Salinibius halmophilus]